MKTQINKILITLITLLFNLSIVQSQFNRFIDTVFTFKPGTGQNSGQSPEYFPKNIFGPPSSKATSTIPESSPNEILSIGIGGEIIVGFKNSFIIDGEGVDFIIFENAFINPIKNKVFAEPALVSVSEDGVNYLDFPFDSLTLEGCAGTQPTNGIGNPFDYNQSGGNGFDIATLGVSRIKYIKIKDISNIITDNTNHPFYDPTISGFDLDAVAGIYVVNESTNISKIEDYNLIYNQIRIYDYLGSKLGSYSNVSLSSLKKLLQNGIYIAVFETNSNVIVTKLCIE